ncbi:MAG TPA: c-type cytochrome [Ramlibacter sp.]|nr:c-type cytochrome [Ramlibacter sp.]
MTKLFSSLFAVLVASVTSLAVAQAPATPAQAPAAVTAQAAGGAKVSIDAKVSQCIGCHGIPGYQATFPEVYRVPKISGQSAKYIASALAAYKTGERKHPTMRGVAGGLSEQDMAEIGAWYEKQGAGVLTAEKPNHEPNAQVGALLQKAACASCHGANFSKPIDPSYPKIAGQHKDYLFVALKAYKTDNNAVVGRSNGVMAGIAKQFSNAELKALADYVGTLDGEMQTHPQSRFR